MRFDLAPTTDVIYLASPYSHPAEAVRIQRFEEATFAAAALMRRGHVIFSPIVHHHPMVAFGLPTVWDYWQRADEALLVRCDRLIILKLVGWEQSRGIKGEIEIADRHGIPVEYLEMEALR